MLIKRIKPDGEYYTFPGGGVMDGENNTDAIVRELKEELSIDAKVGKLLFEIDNKGQNEFYFLIYDWVGNPELGGPEKDRMSEENRYVLEWIDLGEIKKISNLFPREAVAKLQ